MRGRDPLAAAAAVAAVAAAVAVPYCYYSIKTHFDLFSHPPPRPTFGQKDDE